MSLWGRFTLADNSRVNELGFVSLEVAVVAPTVIALIAVVLVAGSLASKSLSLQSAAQAFASRAGQLGGTVAPENFSSPDMSFSIDCSDPLMICVDARIRRTSPSGGAEFWRTLLPAVPPARACSPVVPQ